MAKFNADNHAPSVGQLAMQTAQNPNPAAPATTTSGPPAYPESRASGGGLANLAKNLAADASARAAYIKATGTSLTKKKK